LLKLEAEALSDKKGCSKSFHIKYYSRHVYSAFLLSTRFLNIANYEK